MPSGQEDNISQNNSYQIPDSNTVLQTVKKQEAQFHQIARELDAERQNVSSQLERFRIRDPEDGSATYTENPYVWRPTQISSVIPEDSEFDPKMSESHLHYYPDHGSNLPEYLHEGIPEVEESYTMSYETSTATNGHHEDADGSSNHSAQSSVPLENAALISRSQSQTKTQQVKTITKVIKSREVSHHIGGHPLNSSPYGSSALSSSQDYFTQNPNVSTHEYGTYDPFCSDHPGSPAEMMYMPGAPYADYFSNASENFMHPQAMPQAPRSKYKESGNYEDIDAGGTFPTTQSLAISPGYAAEYEQFIDGNPQLLKNQLPVLPRPREAFDERERDVCESKESFTGSGEDSHHQHFDYAPPREREDCESLSHSDGSVRFRNPNLAEVIGFLNSPDSNIRCNAAAYLTHLCYMDEEMKNKIRQLNAIPALVNMLHSDNPKILRNALGALRNLSFGKNSENKRAIRLADGIPALACLLRKMPDNDIKEIVTSTLWNLSSGEELKKIIIDDCLYVLVNNTIIPLSGWNKNINVLSSIDEIRPHESHYSTVFRNASGVLRNLSSAGRYSRHKLRTFPGLIESIIYVLRACLGNPDSTVLENCCCTLRNLSYKLSESDEPESLSDDKNNTVSVESRATAPLKAVFGENFNCLGSKKKKDSSSDKEKSHSANNSLNASQTTHISLLYSPELVSCYLSLLSESSNVKTLESSAGAIYNLAACGNVESSNEIRSTVRKLKGLPIFVELLRIDSTAVVSASCIALRNLAIDARNLSLIGNYALKDLLSILPTGSIHHDQRHTDNTVAAVLGLLNDVVKENSDFARSLLALGAIERLTYITKKNGKDFSPRVVKLASDVLLNMYSHVELRDAFKKAGWSHSHFLPKPSGTVRNSISSPTGAANNTLSRPASSQGGAKFEDQTLPHGTELNSTAASIPYSRSEELPLNELNQSTDAHLSQLHRPNMFPPGMQQAHLEPVYAQVNRDKKKGRHPSIREKKPQYITHTHTQLLSSDQADMPAGDSWV